MIADEKEEIEGLKSRIHELEVQVVKIHSAFVLMALADLHATSISEPGAIDKSDPRREFYDKLIESHDRVFDTLNISLKENVDE